MMLLLFMLLLFFMMLLVGVVSVVVARGQMDFAATNGQNYYWVRAIIFVLIKCAF